MKETIKQLEKEFKKLPDKDKNFIFTRVKGVDYISNDTHEVLIKQAKLRTLQEVCAEIEDRVLYLNKEKDKKGKKKVGDIVYLHIYDMINELKELLKKFKGEEK